MLAYYSQKQADYYCNKRQTDTGEVFKGLNIYRIMDKDIYITLTSISLKDDTTDLKWDDMKSLPPVDKYGGQASVNYLFPLAFEEELIKRVRKGRLTEEELEIAKQLAQTFLK